MEPFHFLFKLSRFLKENISGWCGYNIFCQHVPAVHYAVTARVIFTCLIDYNILSLISYGGSQTFQFHTHERQVGFL